MGDFSEYVAYNIAGSRVSSSHFKYVKLYLLFLVTHFCIMNFANFVVCENNLLCS